VAVASGSGGSVASESGGGVGLEAPGDGRCRATCGGRPTRGRRATSGDMRRWARAGTVGIGWATGVGRVMGAKPGGGGQGGRVTVQGGTEAGRAARGRAGDGNGDDSAAVVIGCGCDVGSRGSNKLNFF
jgi:hypothetical protein